jgi:methionyl-tRNA formyltransferase
MRVLFFGTPTFAVPSLEALAHTAGVQIAAVITQPDRPAGRGAKIQAPPVKEAAIARGIPVLQPTSVRKEFQELREQLEQYGPYDVGVVIAFGQILPRAMLDYPRAGCINVHASLLPRWRGAAPIQRALLAGDKETGVCLMRMEEGLDTGGVFSHSSTPISEEDTFGSLHDRLSQLGATLLAQDINKIVSGEISSTPQPDEGVTYASKISSTEGELNWSLSAYEIGLVIRGMSPFPGAATRLAGKRLKILFGHPSRTEIHGRPGEVLAAHGDRLEIACGKGAFVISELQLEGKRRMSASEFLRGTSIAVGSILE